MASVASKSSKVPKIQGDVTFHCIVLYGLALSWTDLLFLCHAVTSSIDSNSGLRFKYETFGHNGHSDLSLGGVTQSKRAILKHLNCPFLDSNLPSCKETRVP